MNPSDAPPLSLLKNAALFLDFDGTLVELAEAPDAIEVPGALPRLLRRLHRQMGGRMAIVSGRSIADLERHLDCTGMAIAGSHGLELRLADGTHVPLSAPADLNGILERLERFAAMRPGLLIEPKPASVAMHFRKVPGAAAEVEAFLTALARETGLSIQAGKMVFELRPGGADKGDAVRALMLEPGFSASRPVVLGDDVTDEDAFQAARALGGTGILVGPERETAAQYRLADVAAVAEWLHRAAS